MDQVSIIMALITSSHERVFHFHYSECVLKSLMGGFD
jgi:hypothetical protein